MTLRMIAVSRPTLLLARTFFRRFFESELMQQGIPQVQLVIWSIALVVAPGLLLSLRSALTYSRLRLEADLQGLPRLSQLADAQGMQLTQLARLAESIRLGQHSPLTELAQAMLIDRLLLITISMAVLGLVGLVIWDGVFPDRRDARHLGVLPLPGRVLIVARLVALCAIAALFLIGVNALPTLTYGSLAAEYGDATSTWRGIAAHGIATACAGAFAFFSLIAVQGALLNAVGRKTAERLAVVLQVILVAALLQLVFLLPNLRELASANANANASASANADHGVVASDSIGRWIPSFWFLALYDVLAGRPSMVLAGTASASASASTSAAASVTASALATAAAPAPAASVALAFVAVTATITASLAAIGVFAATHRRLMRLALESRDMSRVGLTSVSSVRKLMDRGPLTRAVSEFTLLTLMRSRPHRMLLSTYIGLACAIIVSTNGPLIVRDGWIALTQPAITLLAAPFVLQFCAVIGTRLLLAIPTEPQANWIVRLYEPKGAAGRSIAIDSVRNVLLALIVLPITVGAGAMAWLLWGTWIALVHGATCAAMGWLIVESVLIGFRKIPFTCTYFPGRSRVRTLWPFYLVALLCYAGGSATMERTLAPYPPFVALFIACVAAMSMLMIRWRSKLLAEPFGLRFEEEDPDALFAGFRFSEQPIRTPSPRTDRESRDRGPISRRTPRSAWRR